MSRADTKGYLVYLPPAQEHKPVCIIQVEVMQHGKKRRKGRKKKEPSPICCSFPLHVWGISVTSSTADNPQITGSYFIMSCCSIPRLPSSPWLVTWRESKRESKIYHRGRTRTVDGCDCVRDRSGMSVCWREKHCTYVTITAWLHLLDVHVSENVKP